MSKVKKCRLGMLMIALLVLALVGSSLPAKAETLVAEDFTVTSEANVQKAEVGVDLNISGSLNERITYNKPQSLTASTVTFDLSQMDKNYEGKQVNLAIFWAADPESHYSSGEGILEFYLTRTADGTSLVVSAGGSAHNQAKFGISQSISGDELTLATKLEQGNLFLSINGQGYVLDKTVAGTCDEAFRKMCYEGAEAYLSVAAWSEEHWSGGGQEITIGLKNLLNTAEDSLFEGAEISTGWTTTADSTAVFEGESDRVAVSVLDKWGGRAFLGKEVDLSSFSVRFNLSRLDENHGRDGDIMNAALYFASKQNDFFDHGENGGLDFYIQQNGDQNFTIRLSMGNVDESYRHDADAFGLGDIQITGTDEIELKTRLIDGIFYVKINDQVLQIAQTDLPAAAPEGLKNILYNGAPSYLAFGVWTDNPYPDGSGTMGTVVFDPVTDLTSVDDFIPLEAWLGEADDNWGGNPNSSSVEYKAHKLKDDPEKTAVFINDNWGARAVRKDPLSVWDMSFEADLSKLDYYHAPQEAEFFFTPVYGDHFTDGNGGLAIYVNKAGKQDYTVTVSMGNVGSYQHNADVFGLGSVQVTGTDLISVDIERSAQGDSLTISINGEAKVLAASKLEEVGAPQNLESILFGDTLGYLTLCAWTGNPWPAGSGNQAVVIMNELTSWYETYYDEEVKPAVLEKLTALEAAVQTDLSAAENRLAAMEAYSEFQEVRDSLNAADTEALHERIETAIDSMLYNDPKAGFASNKAGAVALDEFSAEITARTDGSLVRYQWSSFVMDSVSVTVDASALSTGTTVNLVFAEDFEDAFVISLSKVSNERFQLRMTGQEGETAVVASAGRVRVNILRRDQTYTIRVGAVNLEVQTAVLDAKFGDNFQAEFGLSMEGNGWVQIVQLLDFGDRAMRDFASAKESILTDLAELEAMVEAIDSYESFSAAKEIFDRLPEGNSYRGPDARLLADRYEAVRTTYLAKQEEFGADEIVGIEISPESIEVAYGQDLDLSDLTAHFRLESGALGEEIDLSEAFMAGFDRTLPGEQSVTFTVTVDGKDYVGVLTVTVLEDQAVGLSLTPDAVTSAYGEDLDLSKLSAVLTFASGAEQAVSLDGAEIEGFDKNREGEQTVLVKVTVDGVVYQGSLKVTVERKNGCGGSILGGMFPGAVLLVAAAFALKRRKTA